MAGTPGAPLAVVPVDRAQEGGDRVSRRREEVAFVAAGPSQRLSDFLEATVRPFAEGCDTEPIGYIEGSYVDAAARRRAFGGRLVEAAKDGRGSPDGLTKNRVRLRAHRAIGYEDRERLIHFRKGLTPRRHP